MKRPCGGVGGEIPAACKGEQFVLRVSSRIDVAEADVLA